MKKQNVVVLFGGVSSEHQVSCVSAASILKNADKEKYNLLPVGITKDGQWFLYESDNTEPLENGVWLDSECLTPAILSPDRKTHGLVVFRGGGLETVYVDCVFPVLHGANGEDGTMQGLLEIAGIPYVGPGVAASANGMDKSITKIIAKHAGVRQAEFYLALRSEFEKGANAVTEAAENTIGSYPVFVKPCSSGSSVGVSKAKDRETLKKGLADAFKHDSKVLVEEFIDGHEVEVAVLGNDEPIASIAGEVAPTQEFYTYDAKYRDDSSALYIPARIDDKAMQTVREAAVKVYRALGCEGLSRVDFFCTYKDDEIVFNEINTIPGFTSISMYPKLFQHGGLAYAALIDRLIALAMEKTEI